LVNVGKKSKDRTRMPIALLLVAMLTIAGKPRKPKPPPPEQPAPPGGLLPTDLNKASMRVIAVDTLYQLDLTRAQLEAMRTAAEGSATNAERSAPKGNPRLVAAFENLNRALLDGKDDEQIAKLRNELSDLSTADDVHLDDEIRPTVMAMKKAASITRQLTSSQIAAYLASHADEVNDPVDKMVASLPSLHDAGGSVDSDSQDVADDIAHLVLGVDSGDAAALSAKVLVWLKANRDLPDDQLVSNRVALGKSARKVLGEFSPMDVLSHWMDNQVAILLSNPQSPQAISAMLTAKERE
jgi:hypothetical protein